MRFKLEERLEKLSIRISAALDLLDLIDEKIRKFHQSKPVRQHLSNLIVSSSRIRFVDDHYYSYGLKYRALLLGCNTQQLTKSLIIENTAKDCNSCTDIANSKYYCVIIQYTEKLNTEKVRRLVRNMKNPEERLPRKQINFQHAAQEVAEVLSGFRHNAVSPFGMASRIPVIISSSIVDLPTPKFIWLGGGHELVKLGISVKHLIESLNPMIGDIGDPRVEYEEE